MDPIEYRGEKFYYQQSRGYYRSGRGAVLHRVVYAHEVGPIPEGGIVHHRNGNKVDNRVENLELLASRGDHIRRHVAEGGAWGAAAMAPEARSDLGRRSWEGRPEAVRQCHLCGEDYSTRATYSRWCSKKCRVAARYRGLTLGQRPGNPDLSRVRPDGG